MSYYMPWGHLW